jgi:hypothetical protein
MNVFSRNKANLLHLLESVFIRVHSWLILQNKPNLSFTAESAEKEYLQEL